VSFSYPARPGVLILKDLCLDCPPGKVVALVGPSGGGKSTCISLLERLYEPQSGSVMLDGIDVHDYDHDAFHSIVGIVEQEPVLFARSLRENILYGCTDLQLGVSDPPSTEADPGEEVLRAAKLANAHDFISAMPQGYETEVGQRGVQLSGGQRQRISIARALVRRPKVLLLDEATSALDSESEVLVQRTLENLIAQNDMTVLVVAHRLSTVKRAHKICVIRDGAVVEQGTHDELFEQRGHYHQLVRHQLYGGPQEGEE